jgi:hypothetical protein
MTKKVWESSRNGLQKLSRQRSRRNPAEDAEKDWLGSVRNSLRSLRVFSAGSAVKGLRLFEEKQGWLPSRQGTSR